MPGSPPRVRGKVVLPYFENRRLRITPACAGKSLPLSWLYYCARDHPRVCGEKPISTLAPLPVLGSPPRVRGKVPGVAEMVGVQRITPACAGKSLCRNAYHPAAGDHPRVCGEKTLPKPSSTQWIGSPPRVRGKENRAAISPVFCRITPACAGKRLYDSPFLLPL